MTNKKDQLLESLLKDHASEEIEISVLEAENFTLSPILDEINYIEDEAIRSFVRAVLLNSPYFFEAPAGMLHNPPDERLIGGNVLHTKRVVRIARLLCESQARTPYEIDIITAAAILHDSTKASLTTDNEFVIDSYHSLTVDKLVEYTRERDLDKANSSTSRALEEEHINAILRLIRCHMGQWSPIPEVLPLTSLEWVMHFADYIASSLHLIIDGDEIKEWRWNDLRDSY